MSTTLVPARVGGLKTAHIFLFIVTALLIDTWVTQNHIMTRQVYHNLLGEQLEAYRIDMFYGMIKKLSVWNYVVLPLVTFLRILFVALLIQLPLVLKFIDVPFSHLFRIATIAFLPLLTLLLIKTVWLLQYPRHSLDAEALSFVPLSLAGFMDASHYSRHVVGFLANFNLFEISWCVIIALLLPKAAKIKKSDAALLVLFIWTVIIVFRFVLVLYLQKANS